MRQLTGEMLPSELMVRGMLLVKPHFSFLPLEGIVFLLQELPQLRFEQLDAGLEMRSCSVSAYPQPRHAALSLRDMNSSSRTHILL